MLFVGVCLRAGEPSDASNGCGCGVLSGFIIDGSMLQVEVLQLLEMAMQVRRSTHGEVSAFS